MEGPQNSGRRTGRLHVIISDTIGDATGSRPRFGRLERAEAALDGGAETIQYRRKDDPSGVPEEGRELLRLCRRAGVPLIINDHVDLCLALDADGVHLGLTDTPIDEARRRLGQEKIIGGTARNIRHVREAAEAGADYVGFGPVWETGSKVIADSVRGVDHLREVTAASPLPVIAIGGIDVERCREAIRAGAHGVAVIGVVAQAANPREVVTELIESIDHGLRERDSALR